MNKKYFLLQLTVEIRWICCVLSVILLSCNTSDQGEPPLNEKDITIGKGSFVYEGYAPLKNRPLNVWFYNPADHPGETAELPVMILMHGNSRAAESYRDAMISYAYEYGFLLIVPEFSKEYFPTSKDYHQGGVLTDDGDPVDEEDWAFSLIEPLFDHIKQDTGHENDHYYLYGFSAGSQFVHRFMMHKPDNHARSVVMASAGTYSMPDFDIAYSYGLKNTVVTHDMMEEFLRRDVTVMVGDADTVRSRSDLVKSPEADRQGWHRVERGQKFFNKAKVMADSLDTPFNWKFKLISRVGHSQSEMAAPAADMLFKQE